MKTVATIIIFFICYSLSLSQKEASIWYFGNKAGLDFRNGPPVALTDGAMNTMEGCATICDTSGNLLFYSDGVSVWNRRHNVMPNGTDLLGHFSSTQSSIIVPNPGNSDIYYIFTTDAQERSLQNGVRYSVVDMSLDNNLGDVTTKNVLLFARSTEKITAVLHENKRDIWVITHDWESRNFRTFLVTTTGVIATPVISTVGLINGGQRSNAIGCLKVSSNGKWLVSLVYYTRTIQLFDFNNSNGTISNPKLLQDPQYYKMYGAEFSPDNKLLYTARSHNPSILFQFDLTVGDATAINNSRIIIATDTVRFLTFQIGPDLKIYTAILDSSYIGVINDPNVKGLGCDFVMEGVPLDGRLSKAGLPSFIQSYFHLSITGYSNSPVCEGETIHLTCDTIKNRNYKWEGPRGFESDEQNPDIPNATPEMSGQYIITISGDDGRIAKDTVSVVVYENLIADAGPDIEICFGEIANLNCDVTNGEPDYEYSWEPIDGLNDPNIADPIADITEDMTYIVTVVDANGCTDRDTVDVKVNENPIADTSPEIKVCYGETAQLNCIVTKGEPEYEYSWEPPDGLNNPKIADPVADITEDMTYVVTVTDANGCMDKDTVEVQVVPLPIIDMSPVEKICGSGGVVIGALADGGGYELSYSWSPSEGLNNDTIAMPVASPVETTTYIVTVTNSFGCESYDTVEVIIYEKPIAKAGSDKSICSGDSVQIGEVATSGTAPYTYLWSKTPFTDLSSYDIETPIAKAAAEYIVEVTDVNGCVDYDTMYVDFFPGSIPELGEPKFACTGEEIELTLDKSYEIYLWQDGSTAPTFRTTVSDTCWVRVEDENGCIGYDTVIVTIYPNPVLDIGENINVCEGDSVIIEAPDTFKDYLWHNGSTGTSITVTKTDTCWLRVTDINGCVAYDTVIVTIYPNPIVDLGMDQEDLCEGDMVELNAGGGFKDYEWSDRSNSEKLFVDKSGEYRVKVTSYDGCVGYDTVQVTFNPKLADTVHVWLENQYEFEPYDDITIKLMASFVGPVDSGELISFESTISYYRSSLFITSVDRGNILSNDQNGELNLLTFKTNDIPVTNDTILLAEINGRILLSDSSSNKLIVEEFSWEDFNEECDIITRGSSEFRVDACGFDLMHIKSFLPTQMSFNPNPALNNTTFEIKSEEQGYFTLSIYSTEGIAQFTTKWQNHTKEKFKEINVDLSNFPSGIYQVVLKSPWNIISKRLSIIK